MTRPTSTRTTSPARRGPLLSAGVFIGAGMGGFIDGIVLHQILQWHNMLSNRLPPDTLVNAKANMFYDGLFHAGVWLMTALGIALLWRAVNLPDVPRSGRTLGGAVLGGYGLFNLTEGTIDHHLLRLHHVYEYTANKAPYDWAFLASGVLLLLAGTALVRSARD